MGEPTPRKKEKKKRVREEVDRRQPVITSFMSQEGSQPPAHVMEKDRPRASNVLGGRKTGISRLLKRENNITSRDSKSTYKLSDLFSSEDD